MRRMAAVLLAPLLLVCLAGRISAGGPEMRLAYYPSYGFLRLQLKDNLFRTPEGRVGLKAEYFSNLKLQGKPTLVRTDPTVGFRWGGGSPDPAIPRDNFTVRWTGTFGPVPRTGTYEFKTLTDDGVRLWLDGKRLINDWRPHPPAANVVRVRLEKGARPDIRLEFFEKGGGATCVFSWQAVGDGTESGAAAKATVTVSNQAGKQILQKELAWDPAGGETDVQIGDVPDGTYTVAVRAEGYEEPATATFHRKHFVWEGNQLGISSRVYPPFTPIEQKGEEVGVVLRRYRQSGLGFWTSVEAQRNDPESAFRELLAGPITLRVNDGQVPAGQGKFSSVSAHEVVYEGAAAHPAVTVKSRCTTEYDGCMKVELDLLPGTQKQQLQRLWLEIPVRDEEAPLWHVTTTGLRANPAGKTPAGEGRVWDSRARIPQHRPVQHTDWTGNFKPYVWLGAEARGLCWFADNDRGWVCDYENNAPCLTLDRDGARLVLRVHLVQKSMTVGKPRRIVFGLMASPAKPMRPDWRRVLVNRIHPGYLNYQWMGSQYWGSAEFFSAKYPINGDMGSLNKMQEVRLTRDLSRLHYFKEVYEHRNLQEPLRGGHTADQVYKLLDVSLRRSARRPDLFGVYWEEFVSTSGTHPEVRTFKNEWSGTYGYGSTAGIVPSYRDFACWYGAEFLRRGIGLYFDNAFPERAHDPVTTSAYRLPDGRIQPTAGMWARREYLKRIWVLHQQLAPARTKPVMTIHMTNTHMVPYMVWNDSNLDLEWKYGPEPLQTKFSPDLLRAEAIGLQTGNMPQALARVWQTKTDEQRILAERSRFGVLMVHEIKAYMPQADGRLLVRVLNFGYGQPGCAVHRYWDAGYPVKVSDERVKSLLLVRGGRLMLIVCTWNPEAAEVTFTLDTKRIGVRPTRALNAEGDEPLPFKNNKLTLALPRYGVRIIKFDSANK